MKKKNKLLLICLLVISSITLPAQGIYIPLPTVYRILELQGDIVYYTNDIGLDNSVRNRQMIESCNREVHLLAKVIAENKIALNNEREQLRNSEVRLSNCETLNNVKDERLLNSDKIIYEKDLEIEKINKRNKLKNWAIPIAFALGILVGLL